MRPLVVPILAVALLALSTTGAAAAEEDHAAHHPPGASAPAPGPKTPARQPPSAAASDATMTSMRDMHAKMMAARTMEERQALMGEHMKAMQDGMRMMGRMKGDQAGTSLDAMAKRMDMMEMMMQMMVDREAARAPASTK